MSRIEKDEAREQRIIYEIVVDAYDYEERAMGWYYYLEEALGTGFQAICCNEREISPLAVGEKVKVLGMASMDECHHEMFALIQWTKRVLGVPLSQLNFLNGDDDCQQAVEDWHYWTNRGYSF